MYAVIMTGGKQYRVSPGQVIRIEKLEYTPGEVVVFDKVLMIAQDEKVTLGKPYVGTVKGEVLSQGRCDKIRIIKFKRRKHHMKHQGHRQYFTEVRITDIAA
jgi:large subunit ribosomal protein L21